MFQANELWKIKQFFDRIYRNIFKTKTSSNQKITPSSAQSGFVLPYVLAVIAILSLISILGAKSLRSNSETIFSFRTSAELTSALNEAEEVVTFLFLTRPMVSSGLDLSDRSIETSEIAFGDTPDESELEEASIWQANGTARVLTSKGLKVVAEYQDVTGLVSLNTGTQDIIELALEHHLRRSSTATSLAAKLIDYRDMDSRRSFLGGERADYRLKGLREPTNSAIRRLEELEMILDWQLSIEELEALTSFFTAAPTAGFPSEIRMKKVLQQVLAPAKTTSIFGPILGLSENEIVTARFPSETGRFTLTVVGQGDVIARRRIVEIERTAGAPNQAFQRRLVASYPVRSELGVISQHDDTRAIPLPWAPGN